MKTVLKESFGDIDIYLFDQLLKGRFDECKTILDVGCGYGRNLHFFLKNDFEVFGIDKNPEAIEAVKALSQQIAPKNSVDNFQVALVEDIPFPNHSFDVAICSAVLHFAQNRVNFEQMLQSIWRVLKPDGFFFARLASNIGLENQVISIGNGRFLLPDGDERYLVDEQILLDYTRELHGELFEYIKTTNVQNLRCMTTWCVRKL